MTYILCIGDPHRFRRSRDVGCYLGLKPAQKQSGDSAPELGITKNGNELLRRTLVQSAHDILGAFGPDTDLRRWGLKLAGQGKGIAQEGAHRGGAQARGPAPPAVGNWRDVPAAQTAAD